jgi:GT2 family glycosyltransferase
MIQFSASPARAPRVSVVVLNYNGQQWLARCLDSLARQTIFSEIEVVLTDNNSTDDSIKTTEAWFAASGAKGRVVQNGTNLFYCGANNNGAAVAAGEFLLFLNQDAWLEPDCLEKLHIDTKQAGAQAAAPLVMDYDDNHYQSGGVNGFDWFGLATGGKRPEQLAETFNSPGCSLFIQAEMFQAVGGFPTELLGYADETDLCWRVWIAGGKIVCVPLARVHHRGAAVVNPKGRTKVVEHRTSDAKRFLTNRNNLLCLLKNGRHVLLLLVFPQLLLLAAEALAMLALTRRWSHVRKAYLAAIWSAFQMRGHVFEWRRRIAGFRRRGDFFMLRFLKLKPSRWVEARQAWKFGPPKVDAK